jgi:sigma-E factor negative regulatory protein RseC
MIEESASVVEVRGGRALVQTVRSSGCEHCAARGACAGLGGGREARVWVEDPLGVHPGERVVVAVPEGAVVRASIWVYLVPVVALLLGALLGNALAPRIGLSPDLGAAGLGVAAMVLAFLATRRLGGTGASGPTIVRRA